MARTTVAALMAEHRFAIVETGGMCHSGNCTAYMARFSEGFGMQGSGVAYITDWEEPIAPTLLRQAVALTIYPANDQSGEPIATLHFHSVRQALDALIA